MNDRIEWIEPEEVAQERQKKLQQQSQRIGTVAVRTLLVLSVPIELSFLQFAPEEARTVGLALAGLFVGYSSLFLMASWFPRKQSQDTFILNGLAARIESKNHASFQYKWHRAASFEITNHETLPGIRTLILHMGLGNEMHFHFRAGQLDEAELSAFVSARIAEPVAQRLMRRMKH